MIDNLLKEAERERRRELEMEARKTIELRARLPGIVCETIAQLSEQNIDDARCGFAPETIQAIANTSVIGLRYRTRIESGWR
ncbi:DUF7386 family protein [Halomontanus rarus]|uniref:DUF7386 family protein n=1 Tax=Halomontanus rarus TaxID=3034020 RepID=UPI0023E8F30D|nr:hypothetical protein [Halovivax sp. TS33]